MTNKEYHHLWYLAHKKECNRKSLLWAKNNRTSRNKSQRKYQEKHPSFTNWLNMMERCYRKTNSRYSSYGGRGIKVCKRWHKFKLYELDFGKTKPDNGYTVDRIDNNVGYQLDNVKWATKSEQTKNQRHINRFTKGRLLCQAL